MYASNSLMSSGPSGRSDVNAFYTHEKEDFRDLNSRLEHYISRVKGLEKDNQELVNKLRHLHETWGQQNSEGKASLSKSLLITREESITAIKLHAKEAIKARRTKEKIGLISKRTDFIRRAEQDDRARCAELRSQITKAEADLELQLRENGRLADERAQLSAQNASLYHEYDRIWEEIDRVRLELAEYQAKEERLIAEKEFLMKVQQREVDEINNLLAQFPFDAKTFFANDIANAIRDIKREYEASHEIIRTRVTTYYKQKADEMRRIAEARASDELKHRRAQIAKMEGTIGDLRNKFRPLEDRNHLLEKEYNDLQLSMRRDEESYEQEKRRRDAEYSNAFATYQRLLVEHGSMSEVMLLELEIYRKMIECEEKRWGKREVTRHYESLSQITKHRTYEGDIRIKDCDEHGTQVVIENAGVVEHRLSGFRVSRVVDGMERSFTFPPQFVLHAGQTVLISANLHTAAAHGHHHTFALDLHNSWGVSPQTITYLYDSYGREVARFELKTV